MRDPGRCVYRAYHAMQIGRHPDHGYRAEKLEIWKVDTRSARIYFQGLTLHLPHRNPVE